MEAYYEYTNGSIMSFQRELAEYLASFRPTAKNVYITLLRELASQRVIYSSLNYDLLFELSAASIGLFTNYSSEYKRGGVRLLKFHGSSNFWPDLPTGMIRNVHISGSGRADIQAQIKPLNQIDTLNKCRLEDSIAPAIAMFAVGKTVKVSPDYVEHQYDLWKTQVIKSSKIFIVGVRVHEIDEHIWSLLGQVKGKITYFGFEGDKGEFEQWKENHKKKNAYFLKSDFENAVSLIRRMIHR
ncbi:hypothetical protein G113_02009 [Aeromonas molluscorum 848]|uniref:SIR2-like domain-containing protein n=2 Tax=Aeromonas molluscorum TaxID=271417 RepID=R1FAH3_9GAMM|nr:hypothetical protein G113_02009 [Aeromonas molluscorum 848]